MVKLILLIFSFLLLPGCVTSQTSKISELEYKMQLLETRMRLLELGYDELYEDSCPP